MKIVIVAGFAIVACHPTPDQRHTTEDAACQVVAAFAGTPNAEELCATAAELADMALFAKAKRADAGKIGARSCTIIPTTTTCATDEEISEAIAMTKAKRAR